MTPLDRVDWRLLGWLLIWSWALTLAMAGLINGQLPDTLTDNGRALFGFAVGGLMATWMTTGTWVALIHLPDVDNAMRQRQRPRYLVGTAWLINALVLALAIRQSPTLLIQIFVMVAIGITGPLIVWHWTHRRIHHGDPFEANRRSIRQLLGVTFTAALAIAALNLSYRWQAMNLSQAVLTVYQAIMWTVLLQIMLSRYWWAVLLTIPLLLSEWFVVASLIDLRGPLAESQLQQSAGCILGFYCLALLFLMLMRSSGHRWLAANRHPRSESSG